MVKQCYVLKCPTGRKSCKERVSLFKAPNDIEMLEKWRHLVPQKERLLMSTDRICERHFKKKYVISRWQPSFIGDFYEDHHRSKLTVDAIPTIFENIDPKDPRIRKYVPQARNEASNSENKSVANTSTIPEKNIFNDALMKSIKVSELDSIPICFRCLIGMCKEHVTVLQNTSNGQNMH
ncbi:hypothetical protein AVEN_113401-1 [Araneus ventricosus]|uniref:THAP-type domain-containing protein n=1 Tax=Araneus ventricosus TaxID=182803 RepID=A0A4Y2I0K7_ARAVE|nr:hypothetical protein AVEN_113401-1 [Araneus ventricosus]